MKTKLCGLLVLTALVLFTSCTKDEVEQNDAINYEIDLNLVQKNDAQMSQAILDLVNDHRVSVGLTPLVMDQAYASAYAVDHTDYMISLSQINHHNFHIRSEALKSRGAVRVGENVAYGYDNAESVVNGWLNSPSHKEIIEGNFTHSGFGVFQNEQGRYFFLIARFPVFLRKLKVQEMAIQPPFNLNQWIEENRDFLKPPVGNKNLYKDAGDYIVMIVAGPNARKDYHYNETEELFYQLEGSIKVIIQEDGQRKEMELNAGDMYLHPAKVPHSPSRSAGSIGLVIERKRAGKGFTDGLLWFCDNCNHKIHETYFELHDIEKDFLPHFKKFYNSEELRTCSNCGTVMETDPRFTDNDN